MKKGESDESEWANLQEFRPFSFCSAVKKCSAAKFATAEHGFLYFRSMATMATGDFRHFPSAIGEIVVKVVNVGQESAEF